MPDPRYTFSQTAHRYRNAANGQFVAWERVSKTLYAVLDQLQEQAGADAQAFRTGDITRAQYEARMIRTIKDVHIISGELASGGRNHMSAEDYGRVGGHIAKELRFFRGRLDAIDSGEQKLDGTLNARSKAYVQSAKETYSRTLSRKMQQRGFDEERSILNPFADHCRTRRDRMGCVEAAALEWQPIGTLPPIGGRACYSGCRCTQEFRRSFTGQTRT